MKKILPILFFFCAHFFTQAQQVQLAIGESAKNEFFYDTKFDPTDGGTISVGGTKITNTNDCYLVKLNAAKQIVWQKTIPNVGEDYLHNVQICANGDYVTAGQFTVNGIPRGFVARINSTNGNIIWSTTSAATGSANGDIFWGLKETASGNIAVVGPTNFTPGLVNGIAVLLNSTGTQIWGRIFNYTAQSDLFSTVNQLPNGNLIIGGFYYDGSDNTMILELNETTAAVISQNEYRIALSNPNPLGGNFLNSIDYPDCIINNGNVYFVMNVTDGCCGQNNSQGVYLYNQSSKALSGSLFHHVGYSKIGTRGLYPLGANDFIISQSILDVSNRSNVFVSRVTNGVKIYDRRIVNTTNTIYALDINGNNLNAVGASTLNTGDGYSMFSTIDFPTSTSGCNINNADSLVITANTPTKAINSTPLISVTAMTPLSLTSTNTSAVVTNICGAVICPLNTLSTIQKCSNQNINLIPRAGTTYLWSPAIGLSGTTIQSPVCSATTSTTYIATIFNSATNCTYRDTFNVNVNTPAAVTTQPTPVTVCNGNTATFTGAGTGTGATYQWLSGPTAAGPFTNVTTGTGANTGTYTTPLTTPAMNGTYYLLVVSTTACPAIVTTTAVQLTVNTIASIVTQPASQTVCTPQPATFSVGAIGTGLTYQWQISTAANPTFTNIVGATGASYTTSPTTFSMNNNRYLVRILSTCSPTVALVSDTARLIINNPSIAQQPVLQSGCAGDSYTFSVTATSAATLSYQWQSSANGLPGTFTNIAGANGNSYTITNAPISLNGYYYRVYISVPCGVGNATDTSIAVRLLLSNRIAIVLTAPYTSNNNPAVNSGIFTTVSPAGNYIYTWKRNGVLIPNTYTSKYILLAVDDEASYEVSITDSTTNCISRSNIIKTTAKTSDNLLINELFIYPNPASNRILIRFNNSNRDSRNTMINIYDSKGAKVYSNAYPIVGTFGNMQVDISNLVPETYMVYLIDATGKKLAGGKFVKIR
jgi:hypothetical protein